MKLTLRFNLVSPIYVGCSPVVIALVVGKKNFHGLERGNNHLRCDPDSLQRAPTLRAFFVSEYLDFILAEKCTLARMCKDGRDEFEISE